MIKKYKKRYNKWEQNVRVASPFVIICGVVAVVYLIYRVVLVLSPAINIEQRAFNPGANNIVCGSEEGSHLQDPEPILSVGYQKRIQQQKALSANLVTNPDLTQISSDSSDPAGYSHSVDSSTAKYELLRDSSTPQSFLRITNSKDPSIQSIPAWQMDPVAIEKSKTYAYSLWYRSTVPVDISISYVADGKTHYKDIMTVDSTSTWKQFTADFNNDVDATSLAIIATSGKAGQIDTRGFDIHQIPDASLPAGMVTVAFDDGWQSTDSHALKLLNKYGIKTTQYIISDVARHAVEDYMDYATITNLKKAGNEIGSHSLTHCNQTQLSPTDLESNALGSKQMLEQQKLGPIQSFAYPLGQYNQETQSAYERYYTYIRSSDAGYNDRYFDSSNIHSMGVLADTSDQEFQSWIDTAKAQKLWVVVVYHRVDDTGDYSVTSAQLDHQLQMIKASGLTVLPLSTAAASIHK